MDKKQKQYIIKLHSDVHKDLIDYIETIPIHWRKFLFIDALNFYMRYRNHEKEIIDMIANKNNKQQQIEQEKQQKEMQKQEPKEPEKPIVSFSINDILKNI